MSQISPREFLELLKKSELIERSTLKRNLAELNQEAGGAPVKLNRLAGYLVESGLITDWHRQKLMDGKYRGFFLGQYRLLRLLGTGGMSTVYVAEHRLSHHRRAIKVLPRQRVDDKSYLDRFYREGRAAASLNHPNIVRIYDLANEDDNHYMVMEYVEGTDLQELVRRDGPLPVDTALEFIRLAATGLKHAHDRKIVHRDVKPSNLIAVTGGGLKVLDLGLALMNEGAESLTILHNDRVMGTADYLSPEQAINSHEVDHRADIYSLGCTLFFLLTGQPPFPDGSIAQRIAMHQSQEPPLVSGLRPDCPDTVAQLVHVMIRKSREDRIQTCLELIAEIRAIQAELTGEGVKFSGEEGLNMQLDGSGLGLMNEANPAHPATTGAEAGNIPKPAGPAARKATGRRGDTAAKPPSINGQSGKTHPAPRLPAGIPPPNTSSVPPSKPASKPVQVPPSTKAGSDTGAASGKSRVITVPELDPPAPGPAVALPRLTTTQQNYRQRQKSTRQSIWIVGGIVAMMFAVLLLVLYVALSLVQ